MQNKHSFIYLIGRGLPGLVNFFALTIYTRLLAPDEYGRYALVIATVSLFNMSIYQWIRLALLRFLPQARSHDDSNKVYAAIFYGFVISSLITSVFALGYYVFWNLDLVVIKLLIAGLLLLFLEALFEIGLEYFRSNLFPAKYSYAFISKSILAFSFGVGFTYLNLGGFGIIFGFILADILICILYFRKFFSVVLQSINSFDGNFFRTVLLYGIPLSFSFALNFIINSSDRFFITYYLGESSNGLYSVGYDLSRQSLWVIMTAINLASFPLVLRALEKDGVQIADKQLKANFTLLLGISLPSALGLAILSDDVANLFLGKLYAKEAALILPYISIGALVSGFKTFYFDQSFQLAGKTFLQLWSVLTAAIVNIVLNVTLIPSFGIIGAVYSTIFSFGVSLLVSIYLSKRAYKMPMPWQNIGKITFSAAFLALTILSLNSFMNGVLAFFLKVLIGGCVYLLCLNFLKVFSLKVIFKRFL